MRHRNKGVILDRKKQAREMMLRNLASSLIIHKKTKTTQVKAKAVKPLVEKLITVSKQGDLTARRRLIASLLQKKAIKEAIDNLGVKYKDRDGGYTRIIKLGRRQGDGAEMAQIEFV
ncbi:MAG: 50S ribosomal protein L17 [Patescibacteria group bacterium]|nr:50S ribosomal protein L17 [Patescibacteria group bacterium]